MERTDFFALTDSKLKSENFAEFPENYEFLGSLDPFEFQALEPFWQLCDQAGIEAQDRYIIKISASQVPVAMKLLGECEMPVNAWHEDLKSKFSQILRRALETKRGILGIA